MNGVRVRVGPLGRTVQITRHYEAGARIACMSGRASMRATRFTIQTSRVRHFVPQAPWRYLNHSCDPTADVRLERGRPVLVARRRLAPGDALTYDYATTEFKLAVRSACRCRTVTCRGRLAGYASLCISERKRVADRALPYLRGGLANPNAR